MSAGSLPEESEPLTSAIRDLYQVVASLRGRDGCPWDLKQTRETLRSFVLEEAFELVEAIDGGSAAAIRDELGDLLFQVVLQARIAEERGEFDLADVAAGVAAKLVARHPHVFGGDRADSAEAVEARWEDRKRREREATGEEKASVLAGVPVALPALLRAHKVQQRAARVGFDWERAPDILHKLDEERAELAAAMDSSDGERLEHELGDIIFTAVNLARACGLCAEDALRRTTTRFMARFQYMESLVCERGHGLDGLSLEELERLWAEAKAVEKGTPPAQSSGD